jgi:hypothetical protein
MAEDLHALGFVVLTLLLTSLAQVPTPEYKLPDEDTLQRLLTDIFEKDMEQFHVYVEAEEVWSNVIELLDDNENAGWEFLESLLFAFQSLLTVINTNSIPVELVVLLCQFSMVMMCYKKIVQ